MPISDALLPEFDHEMATTRKFLERVPDERLNWKPHQKSFSMGQLSTHLSNIPSWVVDTMKKTELDIAPVGQPPYREQEKHSRHELLEAFDKNIAAARQALSGSSDATLMQSWSLLQGGKPIMTMPRIAVLRSFILSHIIHHRAQLGVYLRLCDIPVPSAYGPTADEKQF
jgi:uncharacterized damage-inducible protein DinB